MKTCSKCNLSVDESLFHTRKKRGRIVFRSWCRDCEAEDSRKRYKENSVKFCETSARIKKENREKYNFYERNRKYRIRSPNPNGKHSFLDWEEVKIKYNFKCLSCGRKEPEIKLTGDHIIPVSKGGSNSIDNIQPLCIKCNQIKNNKTISYVF